MFDFILNILKPETFVLIVLVLFPLLLLAAKYPEVVLSLGFPVILFIGQLKDFIPVSTSAVYAVFPLIAIIGGVFKGYRFRFGRIEKAFVLLVGLMVFSLFYSHSPTYGTEKVVLVIGTSLPLVLAASYTIVSFETLKRVLNIICLSLVIYLIISATIKLFGVESLVGDRFGGIQGPIRAARYLALSAIVYFYWWFPRGKAWKVGGFFVVGMTIPLVLLTGTRTAIVSLIGAMLIIEYFREKAFFKSLLKKGWKVYFLVSMLLLVIMFAQPLFSIILPPSLYEARFSSWDRFIWAGDFEQPTNHVLNTVVAWKVFKESPFLGFGVGGYKSALRDFGYRSIFDLDPRHPSYPHNIFLEFLSEQGILGLILFCYMLYYCLRVLLHVQEEFPLLSKPLKRMVLTVVVFFVYGLLVAQTATDIPRQHILWWGMGMLVGLQHISARHVKSKCNAKNMHKYISNPTFPKQNHGRAHR